MNNLNLKLKTQYQTTTNNKKKKTFGINLKTSTTSIQGQLINW